MSLFIKQANLCLPTMKTTEMIEISIIFIISIMWKNRPSSINLPIFKAFDQKIKISQNF